jgi:D-psicose/D-tagatose/L-ribulose 3-epimerase
MKYGAHCYLFTDRWSDDQLGLLDAAKELGLDCFEIAVGDDVQFSARATRQRAEALELELTIGPGGQWPLDCDLSAEDPTMTAQGLAWHKRQVNLAGELGATAYTGALYGHPGVLHYRPLTTEEGKRLADALHQLAEQGERNGVKVVIEPMSHFRTHVVNTPEQAMHLISTADHSNLYVLLDTYHMVTEVRDYDLAFRTCRDRLWGVHACENDRGVPGGGLVPWKAVFSALKEMGFGGPLILESYNSALGDFAFRRGMLHNVCPDGYAFVRQGLAFLKSSVTGLEQVLPH